MLEEIKNITGKVERILEEYPNTRNSDVELIITYAQVFHNIDLKAMRRIPNFESIRRTRQKIQEEGRFKATENVDKARKEEASEMKDYFAGLL